MATVYPGIATDHNIEERRLSIATEERCDNKLRTKANNVRCGGGERNKAAGHPRTSDGNGNGDGNRWRQQMARIGWLVTSHQVAVEMGFCCGELLGNGEKKLMQSE